MKKIKILLLSIISLVLTSSQKTDIDYFEISKNLKLVSSIYEKINTHYVYEVLPGRVMKKGIYAMLKSLTHIRYIFRKNKLKTLICTLVNMEELDNNKKKKNKAIVLSFMKGRQLANLKYFLGMK